jgi:hypothetical protein
MEWKGEETYVDIKMDCRQETEGGTRNGREQRRRQTDGLQTKNRRNDMEGGRDVDRE